MNPTASPHARNHIVLAGVFLLLVLLLFSPWNGRGFDEVFYYSYLSSPLFDGDLDVMNDYYLSNNDFGGITYACSLLGPKGLMVNQFAAGSSLLWFPFYFPVRLVAGYSTLLLSTPPAWAGDRFSAPYLLAISFATLFYGFLTLALIYTACATLFEARAAFWAAIGAVLASPLTVYIFHHSGMAHTQSAFSVALLLYVSLRNREFRNRAAYIVIAAVLALATLVRWQNVIFGLIPAALWVRQIGRRERPRLSKRDLQGILIGLVVFALIFSPQMFYWRAQLGKLLTIPQGRGFMRWTSPHISDVLFSGWNGLYYWHPLLLFASCGLLVWLYRSHDKLLAVAAILCFGLMVYINASTFDWFAGYSFGGRRFCSTIPLMGFGLAAWCDLCRGRLVAIPIGVTLIAVAANLLLHLAFTREISGAFYLNEFRFLGSDLIALLPEWIRTIHLNSQVCVYFLAGQYLKGVLLLLAGLFLVGTLLVLVLRNGFLFLGNKAKYFICGLAGVAVALDLVLAIRSPVPDARGRMFARVLSAGDAMPVAEKKKIVSRLRQTRYQNPLLYSYAVETLGERSSLPDCLSAVREISPQVWAKWVETIPPEDVEESVRREAALANREPFLLPESFYWNQVRQAGQRGREDELTWLSHLLRFNPFDPAALRGSAGASEALGRKEEAGRFRLRLQRFLEAKVETFFATEKRFVPWEATVFRGFYLDYAVELARLYEEDGQAQKAASLRANSERLAPQESALRQRKSGSDSLQESSHSPETAKQE
jgi:uncharacterized membrane protein (DUF485 family)